MWDFMVPIDADLGGSIVAPTSCGMAIFAAIVDSGDYSRVPAPIRTLIEALPTRAEPLTFSLIAALTHYTGGRGSASTPSPSVLEARRSPVPGPVAPVRAPTLSSPATPPTSPPTSSTSSTRPGSGSYRAHHRLPGQGRESRHLPHRPLPRRLHPADRGWVRPKGGCDLDFEPGHTPTGASATVRPRPSRRGSSHQTSSRTGWPKRTLRTTSARTASSGCSDEHSPGRGKRCDGHRIRFGTRSRRDRSDHGLSLDPRSRHSTRLSSERYTLELWRTTPRTNRRLDPMVRHPQQTPRQPQVPWRSRRSP